MDKFFNPKSVVVIGVSESPSNMARNIVSNLMEFGFKGIVYQVGRNEGTLYSRKIYTSVLQIEDPIELAVILTPAPTIPELLEECGKKGIHHIIIESAGFREYGEEGKKLEDKIVTISEKYGIRFIGPNCIGTMNLGSGLVVPFLNLKNNFKSGGISVITQSGGIGFSYLTIFQSENLGVSKFASIGNKINVDENDLLEYFVNDPATEIICVYIEGISDGRRLMEIAEKSKKPIILHKSNIGKLASSLAKSHTAALSSDDAVVSAALKQAGIARVDNRETIVNTLKIMPVPKMRGNQLAIISRSGGHAIIAADASELAGFELSPLKRNFLESIEKHLRGNVIKLTNPIDIGDLFDYDMFAEIIEKTIKKPYVDGVVFMHTYISSTEGESTRLLLNKISEYSQKYDKPVGVCIATNEEEFHRLRNDVSYPIFAVPSQVIKTLAYSRDYYLKQVNKEKDEHIRPHRRSAEAVKIINKCVKDKRNLSLLEGMDIFASYEIPVVKGIVVQTEKEAVQSARRMSCRVAMKVVSNEILHKSDFGGVKLNLKSDEQVIEAYREMMKEIKKNAPKAKIEGVLVQPMVKKGWELILGAKQDPNFGPTVLAGLGGIFVEIFKDSAIRVVPFRKGEAHQMLTELKGYSILRGARGDKPYDIAAAEDAIIKLGRLIADFPQIKEIDINPFYIFHEGKGGFALDARIIL